MILSAPSYVFPGTYAENVRYLASRPEIQAVELLFYYYDPDSRALLLRERPLIRTFEGRLRFSVHMPDLLSAEHEELVELTRDLAERYVVHPPAGPPEAFFRLLGRWRQRYGEVFLLENLIGRDTPAWPGAASGPQSPASPRVPGGADMPLCCDTGHLLLAGASPREFLEKHGNRVREVHLHGVQDGVDHRPVRVEDPWFREILPQLRGYGGVLHLEVFSIAELETCLTALRAGGIMNGPATVAGQGA